MKILQLISLSLSFVFLAVVSCSNSEKKSEQSTQADIKYLALGDSYTIGESVAATQNFPFQLQDTLAKSTNSTVDYKIIARTGWTTTNLLNAIENENPATDYDLVTLLIGVNNQFQGKPFSLYEQEFLDLLNKAIALASGNKDRVIVVSIPDYAFTPFGQKREDPKKISAEIDQYNAFAAQIATENGVLFQNITDITRRGLTDPSLVANDGLHPSGKAYQLFVDRLFQKALSVID
ncbi:MAG TPA: SGNH/GDSL hydrolase family protein [Flavobacteriaceae bacterium]|jgi:lysophospholipase L1-like esterase|nr:SGNH/GDSL hydrolase family protein [Flavobacteriaceae bacterium]HIN98043.1 SGNH/GDSL hydrolase family protein [Flavobacteriaceae bacterium]|tara:strand:- start:188472 stop:189176 length:705 start_codon:yes stop_codon:yes gene_type:complete